MGLWKSRPKWSTNIFCLNYDWYCGEKSSPEICNTSVIFKQSKQSPIGRKFDQSGQPGSEFDFIVLHIWLDTKLWEHFTRETCFLVNSVRSTFGGSNSSQSVSAGIFVYETYVWMRVSTSSVNKRYSSEGFNAKKLLLFRLHSLGAM
jgi:hypothetical protein